ncbi:phage tail length tape measure family protein [Methylobacterium nodulans]|uniref:Bacteriophage tail tape measure N-terminal domain-containing protein n=1 Tax=Methylobacterium nodulans (strain LMG 21967 / CNCM I-2342 / ORS 2060) TaxID=460265 RepID=B8ITN0_METNO|nr:phage tail length tape measure family protein [Methylobacterium nodulans]ACL58946.1 conserved hypothetical protein [Methylobacterium nodulans ORS 2060]
MASIESIRQLTIQARTQGFADAQRKIESTSGSIGTMAGAMDRLERSFDPLYRAHDQLSRISRTLALAVSSGTTTQERANQIWELATQKILKYSEAMDRAARAQRQWATLSTQGQAQLASVNADNLVRQASRRMGSLSYAAGTITNDAQNRAIAASLDPLTAAQQKRDDQLAKADAALKARIITEDQHKRAVAQTNAVYVAQEQAIRRFISNTDASGKAAKLSAYELQNLGYQANDVFSSLASGISPMQTLAQQGPQIYQIMAGSQGGLKGAITGIGSSAMGALRSVGLLGGALGAMGVAAVTATAAALSYGSSMRETDRLLAGMGRASGVSAGQVTAAGEAIAAASEVSRREARTMAATFASTGKIGADMLVGLGKTAKDFAATTGQELPDAYKELAQAFADPARGAETLNEKLGFLNARTRENIQTLVAQGDRLGAQRVLLDAYAASLTKAANLTSSLGDKTSAFGRIFGDVWDKIGERMADAFGGPGIDRQIKLLEEQLQSNRSARGGLLGNLPGASGRLDAEAADIRKRIDLLKQEQRAQAAVRERSAASQRGLEVMDLVRQLDTSQRELRDTENAAEKLRKAISDPAKFMLDGTQLGQVQAAFERLSSLARTMREDVEKWGSVASAQMVRAAQNANANVGLNSVDRAKAEETQRLAAALRAQGLEKLPKRTDVEAEFAAREALADPRDLAMIRAERDARLKVIASRDAEVEVSRLNIERIQKEAEERAKATAVQGDFIQAMINHESGGDRFARNPRSTATGLGQFIEETWERLFRKAFPDRAANMSRDEILGRRTDREDSITLIRVLAEENRRALEKANLPTTNRNQYVAWFAGADRATRLLNADPNEAASAYFSQKAINANPGIIAGRTVGQFLDWADRVINRNTQGNVATRRQADILGAQVRTTDETTYEAARREKAQELLNEAVEKGTRLGLEYQNAQKLINDGLGKVSEGARGEAQALLESADAWAKRNAQVQNSALMREVRFETEQLGRTDSEQRIASRLRGTGLGMDSPEAEGMRMVDTLKEAKDIAKDAFSGLASDLRRGVSAAEALKNVFDRIIDKLMNKGIDALVSGLFDGIGGGSRALPTMAQGGYGPDLPGGGSLGGLGSIMAAASKFFGFADGGYTGAGGRFEPAGIVHRGEYVLDAATTSRIGVSALDTLRANLRGYAAGGYVAPAGAAVSAAMQQAANANAAQQGPVFNATINTQSTGDPEADQRNADANAKAMRAEYERMWMAMAQREMRPGGTLHAAGARRAS